MYADEFANMVKHLAVSAVGDGRSFLYGHVANYDPIENKVRVVLPELRDEDGVCMLSPWMPLGTLGAGQGGGIQYHPLTGATAANPTAGEQLMVMVLDNNQGVAAASMMFFGPGDPPPSQQLPEGAAAFAPGEYLLAHRSGSLLRLHANGDVEVYATGKAIVTSLTEADVTAPIVKVGAQGEKLQEVCLKAFYDWAAEHSHPETGPPTTQPPASGLTTALMAG